MPILFSAFKTDCMESVLELDLKINFEENSLHVLR